MKFTEGMLVKITGGTPRELHGNLGYVLSTCKKTIWILLVEGSREGQVVAKRNMKWVSKASAEEEKGLLGGGGGGGSSYQQRPDNSGGCDKHTIFVAMPKGHAHNKDDVKAAFADQTGFAARNAHVLPSSRNCLLYLDNPEDVQTVLAGRKTVTIGKVHCRMGLHYGGGKAPAARDENRQRQQPFFGGNTKKRPTPEADSAAYNSRAAGLKEALEIRNRRRVTNKRPRYCDDGNGNNDSTACASAEGDC